MKRVSALILLFQLGVCFAANSIIAIVNEEVITLQSIEQQLNDANSFNEKIDIVEQQIDITLQMIKLRELGLKPSQVDIDEVLKHESRHFGALSGQGLVQTALENYEKAIKSYEAVQKIYPSIKSAEVMIPQLKKLIRDSAI